MGKPSYVDDPKFVKYSSGLARANDYMKTFNYREATIVLEDIIAGTRGSPELAEIYAEASILMGWIEESKGMLEEASRFFKLAEEVAGRYGKRRSLVRARIGQGTILIHHRMLKEARAIFAETLENSHRAGFDEETYTIKSCLGQIASLSGERGEARKLFREVLKKIENTPDFTASPALVEIAAATYNRYGLDHFRQGQYEQAFLCYRHSLELLAGTRYSIAKAEALRYMAVIHSRNKEFGEAVEKYSQALAILKYCYHVPSLARLYLSLGRTYMDMGSLEKATVYFQKARVLCAKLDLHSNVAEISSMMGHIAMRKEQYDQALELYREDLAITGKLDSPHALAYVYKNIGMALLKKKNLSEAMEQFENASRQFAMLGDEYNRALVLILMGEVEIERKNAAKAREFADRAAEALKGIKRQADLARVNLLYGQIHELSKETAGAIDKLENAIRMFEESNLEQELVDALVKLGELYLEASRNEDALKVFTRAHMIAGKLGLTGLLEKLADRIGQLDQSEGVGLAAEKLKAEEFTEQKLNKNELLSRQGSPAEAIVFLAQIGGFEEIARVKGVQKAEDTANHFFAAMHSRVNRYGGVIESMSGGKATVFFPRNDMSREPEAKIYRLVCELFERIEDMNKLADAERRPPLELKVGFASGEFYIANLGSPRYREYTLLGREIDSLERSLYELKGNTLAISQATFEILRKSERMPRFEEVLIGERKYMVRKM